jgi:hypothetical protein
MTKSNMYSFIGKDTWNPLGGVCEHSCKYCFTNPLKERFPVLREKYSGELWLDEKAIKKNLGKGHFWFVCSCNDLFAENVPAWMIEKVLEHCWKFENKYLFQSKNPSRFTAFHFNFPPASILATTLESDIHNFSNAPDFDDRVWGMYQMNDLYEEMVTIEPIMQFNLKPMVDAIKAIKPLQVNIGANSNPKIKLPEPEPEKIRELIKELEKFTTVHLKPNLKRLLPEVEC